MSDIEKGDESNGGNTQFPAYPSNSSVPAGVNDRHVDTADGETEVGQSHSHNDHSHESGNNSAGLGHGHSHIHDHNAMGDWETLKTHKWLRWVFLAMCIIFFATVAAMIAISFSGSGIGEAKQKSAELGLGYEVHNANVESIVEAVCSFNSNQDCKTIYITPKGGTSEGEEILLGEFSVKQPIAGFGPGDNIKVQFEPTTDFYSFHDIDRSMSIYLLIVLFVIVVIALSRWRGVSALFSMTLTALVLILFIARSVLNGHDPVLVAVVGASFIAYLSLYFTHGFNPTTTVALAGTIASLALTFGVSWFFFWLADFTGGSSDVGLLIPFISENINVSSLLLAGAVIGALGALDDVTITQVATIAEVHRSNPKLSTAKLFASGLRVGREHIASTVNTLLLAYAGASLPLLLIFFSTNQSWLEIINSETVALEVVRTLCGSIGLVSAVPVTTLLAAVLVGSTSERENC